MLDVKKIEELLQDETKLKELVDVYVPVFQEVDALAEELREGLITNGGQFKNTLTKLVGLYATLSPVASLLEAAKLNREAREFNSLKITIEKAGEKFVAGAVEKQASEKISDYRWARNLFQGYLDATQAAIQGCQSVLKFTSEEQRMDAHS